MSSTKKNVKIAVALRAARAAIGWNQQEFADVMGVAKSTIARIETLEVSPRADVLLQAMEVFRRAGVEVDFFNAEKLTLVVNLEAINNAELRLMNEALRRSDRKGPLALIAEDLAAKRLNNAKSRSPLQEMALRAASPYRRKPKP